MITGMDIAKKVFGKLNAANNLMDEYSKYNQLSGSNNIIFELYKQERTIFIKAVYRIAFLIYNF